jgi:hypothetical protein
MAHRAPYTYHRDADGVDETFDIVDATGQRLVSVPFWHEAEQSEATARLIVDALNAYTKSVSNTATWPQNNTCTNEQLRY